MNHVKNLGLAFLNLVYPHRCLGCGRDLDFREEHLICSACVQSCPTGVLQFGRVNRKTGEVIARDRVIASLVILNEGDPADRG